MRTQGIKVVRTWIARWKMLLIGRWLLVKPGYTVRQVVYSHEGIHLAQERELAYVGFYLWYAVEFLIKLICCLNWQRAYRSVGFEREAYTFENDNDYPQARRPYHWLRLIV